MAITSLPNYKECEKIDARKVNAYLELKLDPTDLSKLVLESSWDPTSVDISDAVHFTETKTTLKLSPADAPTYLEYDGETGVPQCIYGNDLARIIPMTKLKDVNQTTPIANGYVYMYNSSTTLFDPYDLLTFVTNTNTRLTNLESRMLAAENAITAINQAISTIQAAIISLTQRVNVIEETIARPAGVPTDTRIVYGNINAYSDSTNTGNRNSGLYTHSTATDQTNDLQFA